MTDIQMQVLEMLIQKISTMITEQGENPTVISVEARKNIREQLAMYKNICEEYKSEPDR
ncbi:MAG TPA: hypothetical protein VKM55_30915 [Candidatus Lokiarchaeia archaeon]|nr:hypothetical protein [Candidatus Lokiarchaeia archaeon]